MADEHGRHPKSSFWGWWRNRGIGALAAERAGGKRSTAPGIERPEDPAPRRRDPVVESARAAAEKLVGSAPPDALDWDETTEVIEERRLEARKKLSETIDEIMPPKERPSHA